MSRILFGAALVTLAGAMKLTIGAATMGGRRL
jgi:hypothetical protein